MKIKKITKFLPFFALTFSSLTLTIHAQAEDPIPDRHIPRLIQIYSETIEISALEYARLKDAASYGKNHTVLRNKLIQQVEAGKAKLVSNQSIITRPGERATIASINEFSYPSKYESSAVTKVKKTPGQPESSKLKTKHTPTPKDFHTRKIETTLRVSAPFNNDGYKTINLSLEPEIVKYFGDKEYAEWTSKGAITNIKMPNFFTFSLRKKLVLNTGEFQLVGAYTPELDGKKHHTKKLLHFIKGDILKVGK